MPHGDGIKAVQTSFEVVFALRENGPTTVSELSNRLQLPVSTVHSHLSTLKGCKYVVKHGQKYDLSFRFLEEGGAVRKRSRLYQLGAPKVDELADEMEDRANLVTYEHGLAAHIYVADGEQALETDVHTGIRLHSHSSASGKALLSQLSDDEVEAVVEERGLPKHGPNTITDLDELLDELAEIRESGIAFDRQERLEGLRCVAATIRRDDPYPPAAISISGPVGRMSQGRFEDIVPERLGNIADTIRIKLQYA